MKFLAPSHLASGGAVQDALLDAPYLQEYGQLQEMQDRGRDEHNIDGS